ncbi:hypothetical protein B0H66DRAFT_387914 [Apodospora peruviana]|uniref:Uncharacterized protein n=1 Tax=Apodospora peruviana TaxID=516989 RepID=A0AAE0HUL5_9PEZI|nr:hypothetical protein B0H66DRAFT_387914 [Apodospora peruviana]
MDSSRPAFHAPPSFVLFAQLSVCMDTPAIANFVETYTAVRGVPHDDRRPDFRLIRYVFTLTSTPLLSWGTDNLGNRAGKIGVCWSMELCWWGKWRGCLAARSRIPGLHVLFSLHGYPWYNKADGGGMGGLGISGRPTGTCSEVYVSPRAPGVEPSLRASVC